jgi:hypothetical protein
MRVSKWTLPVISSLLILGTLTIGGGPLSEIEGGEQAGSDTPSQAPTAVSFDPNAFPPTMPDRQWHRDGWIKQDCMRCHETGVGDAPAVQHRGLPPILLRAKCRTCHVLIPGQEPRGVKAKQRQKEDEYNIGAFPPMIPDSGSHRDAWRRDDCLLCHEDGIKDAPIVRHEGLPKLLLKVKCRSCHVQIRSHLADLDEP